MGKPKKLNFEVIDRDATPEPYEVLDEAVRLYHSDLHEAEIALAWHVNIKPDIDGHILLGRCVKVSDLYKEFAEFDFIVVINRKVWDSPEFDERKKLALLDHELCHAAVAEDEEGTKRDIRGRLCYRTRKHDIEEFASVVAHHGTYKHDLESFAKLLLEKQRNPLIATKVTVTLEPSRMPDADVERYFRAHANDDPLIWPEGATEEQCSRIWAALQNESQTRGANA